MVTLGCDKTGLETFILKDPHIKQT